MNKAWRKRIAGHPPRPTKFCGGWSRFKADVWADSHAFNIPGGANACTYKIRQVEHTRITGKMANNV